MTYIGRSPRRPPYVRLDGQDCTLFAVSHADRAVGQLARRIEYAVFM